MKKNISDNEELQYLNTLNLILTNIINIFEIQQGLSSEGNIEINILGLKNNKTISPGDLSINFQKQNGSLITICKNDINDNLISKLNEVISRSISSTSLATYKFNDFKEYNITHWCYNSQKVQLNKKVIEDLKHSNEISALKINKSTKKKHK